jgi:hypothetical protein
MGKVSCFKLDGVECWFNSQEHRPPHFHARKKGHWHVRVYFQKTKDDMIERATGPRERMSSKDANALTDMAERCRAELLKEWEKKVRCNA